MGAVEAESSPGARLEARVTGRVQGVGFRYFVIAVARQLGLRGWVENEPDGSVSCVAEGPREALEELLRALWNGPPAARVDRVSARWSSPRGEFDGFGLRSRHHPGD
jgi:acylphosphatase